MIKKIIIIIVLIVISFILVDIIFIYCKYKRIDNILKEVSSRKYVENEYDCIDFSKDFKRRLEAEGISSVIIKGKSSEEYHNWIAIELEPQTGKFLKPNEYKTLFIQ